MVKRASLVPLMILVPLVGLAGCASTGQSAPVDAIRYHLNGQIGRGTVSVEPLATNDQVSLEYQTYASAVTHALDDNGFEPRTGSDESQYIAAVAFARTSRGPVKSESPFRIGLGAGTGGSGVGVGGGASIGLGGKTRELIASELRVQIKRRSDATVVWEGNAVTETLSGTPAGDPKTVADRLAKAVFKDFPGESGITITVK